MSRGIFGSLCGADALSAGCQDETTAPVRSLAESSAMARSLMSRWPGDGLAALSGPGGEVSVAPFPCASDVSFGGNSVKKKPSANDDEIHGTCLPSEERDTPRAAAMNTCSAVLPVERTWLRNSATNGLFSPWPSLATLSGAAE